VLDLGHVAASRRNRLVGRTAGRSPAAERNLIMPLKLGAYTACLHDRPLADALDVLKADGLTSVEVNTGGFIPSPHCPVDALLASAQARRDYLAGFSARDMELTGLNCNGNPLNPLPGVGPKHRDDLRRTIELAGWRSRCTRTTWSSHRSRCAGSST
jgi:hypothetical protein